MKNTTILPYFYIPSQSTKIFTKTGYSIKDVIGWNRLSNTIISNSVSLLTFHQAQNGEAVVCKIVVDVQF